MDNFIFVDFKYRVNCNAGWMQELSALLLFTAVTLRHYAHNKALSEAVLSFPKKMLSLSNLLNILWGGTGDHSGLC